MKLHSRYCFIWKKIGPPGLFALAALCSSFSSHAAITLDQVSYMGYSTDFVAVSGDNAFITVGDEFETVDISDPSDPAIIGSCSLLGDNLVSVGKVAGMERSGNRVFILRDNGSVALQVVDVTDPADPTLMGQFEAPPADSNDEQSITGRSFAVEGNTIYLGVGSFGVYRINAANSSDIFIESSYALTPNPNDSFPTVIDVASEGNRVFLLTANTNDVYSLDFSTPGSPVLLGGSSFSVTQQHVEAESSLLYLYSNSVQLLNAALPATLPLVGNGGFTANALVVSGTTAYSASSVQVRTTDLTTPSTPQLLGIYSQTAQGDIDKGDLALGVGKLALARGSDLGIIDVSTLSTPTLAGDFVSHAAGEPIQAPVFSNGRIFVLTNTSTLTGLNTASISVLVPQVGLPPLLLGSLQLSNADVPNEIAVSGDTIYAVTDTQLIVIDATAPQLLAISGRENHPGSGDFGDTIAANGTTVYTGGINGVNIYDASNPGSIQTVGQYVGDFPNIVPVVDLKFLANRLYCATGASGLQILNVANSAIPLLLSIGNVGGADIREVVVSGNACYARTSDEIIRLNVSDPTTPGIVSQLTLPGTSTLQECFSCSEDFRGTYAVEGTTVYAAGGADGLLVLNFANPSLPAVADTWDTSWLNYVALDNNLLYLAEDALEVTAPAEIGLRIATPPVVDTGGDPTGGFITAIPFFAEEGKHQILEAPEGSGYQWKRNGIDIVDSGTRITGSQSRRLEFDPVNQSDQAVYTCSYDDGSKQVLLTQPFNMIVYPAASVPVAGGAGIALTATALLGLGIGVLRRKRK